MSYLADEITERINVCFGRIFHVTKNGTFEAYVCITCDELLKPGKVEVLSRSTLMKNRERLSSDDWNGTPTLRQNYIYNGETRCDDNDEDDDNDDEWIKHLLLSPRACYILRSNISKSTGFSVCKVCNTSLRQGQMPKFAIANNYVIGSPPRELTDLTDVELAMITPVKTYGYCFTYTGGRQKKLKGALSFYKVKMESIVRTVAHFDVLGLDKDVVLLLYGKMTPEQKTKAKAKSKINPQRIMTAIKWLIANNKEWKERNLDLSKIAQNLKDPIVVDRTRMEQGSSDDSSNDNIEKTESFQVFFPDGSMSSLTGGQGNIDEFRALVKSAQEAGFDIEVRNELAKEAVSDFKDNNLVNACLLQFPYGTGGMHEARLKSDDSYTRSTDLVDYVGHLSRLSQPQFHHELFTLILYNIKMKQHMVRTAGFCARTKTDASMLAEGLTEESLAQAINAKANGSCLGNRHPGRQLLGAVDTIARSVPHTNEAAKRARQTGEAIQHHYGMPSYFLTVTPDDECSLVVQVLSRTEIDNDARVATLSDEELLNRANQRTALRIKYPGICAYYFAIVLDIITKEVIGWNLDTKCATYQAGLFGIPAALALSVEEQGRGTLHAHIQVWVAEFNNQRDINLHSTSKAKQMEAKRYIIGKVDEIVSTTLFQKDKCTGHTFPHSCTKAPSSTSDARYLPKIVPDQKLRNLRHQHGQVMQMEGTFATCPMCTVGAWSNEKLVQSYLKQEIPELTEYPDHRVKRLKAMTIEYQKGTADVDPLVVDAAYNHHMHCASCFGNKKVTTSKGSNTNDDGNKKKRKSDDTRGCECRFRLPRLPRKTTVIQDATSAPVCWALWDGTIVMRNIKEIGVKRQKYDAFQNESCSAISRSKIACNSNVAAIFQGPSGQYTFKYCLKGTQEDDSKEYAAVAEATRKCLASIVDSVQDEDRKKSIRLMLRASFAHQKGNIIGASLASFVINEGHRFLFSHDTVWSPLKDIEAMLTDGRAFSTIEHHVRTPFYQCAALHYLCRPKELEACTAFDFYSQYEVIRRTTKNTMNSYDTDVMRFIEGQPFRHPSYNKERDTYFQVVRKRSRLFLIKICQYQFPDTADFGGSILDDRTPITTVLETYAKLVLLLFYPYRKLHDIRAQDSFTLKLREANAEGKISCSAKSFLQNVQDARSNCFRSHNIQDELERKTTSYQADNGLSHILDRNDDEQETTDALQGHDLDALIDLFEGDESETNTTNGNPEFDSIPHTLDLANIKDRGTHKCGYKHLSEMSMSTGRTAECVFQILEQNNDQQALPNDVTDQDNSVRNRIPSRDDIAVILTRTTRRTRNFVKYNGSEEMSNVLPANGSARSLIDWAVHAKLDQEQKRAFEIFGATFVLTFFSDSDSTFIARTRNRDFINTKRSLQKLAEVQNRKRNQLICLLHGYGGSGKTTVLDLLMEYAKEYCGYMTNFRFTSRTIVMTAMSGVAATILLGQTTHSALYLNQKRQLDAEQVEAWSETRLLIIDEISFASKTDFQKIHANLCTLKQQLSKFYGGLSIIFSGDFRQLEPVGQGKKPVYSEDCPEFKDWLNCYIELKGLHRFSKDPSYGQTLCRIRDGEGNLSDIKALNNRVVGQGTTIPADIKYVTYTNKDRDAINNALFQERCSLLQERQGHTNDSIMIFSDEVKVKNGSGTYVPLKNCKTYYESCGEHDIETTRQKGRMDPVLKIHLNCRVMLPGNIDVASGKANGTQATVEKVVLKPGVQPKYVLLKGGPRIAAVSACQVESIILRHCNDRVSPQIFSVQPQTYTFNAKLPIPTALHTRRNNRETLQMKAVQLPLLINHATTGHKLQGSSVDNLFVNSWTYVTNWVYVVLSRVRTMDGLYLRLPLSTDLSKYAVPESLKRMILKFQSLSPQYWSAEEYDEKFPEEPANTA